MSVSMKNEFQISATPGEELSRHLAYLAAQDNGSILTGGFIKDAAALEREGSGRTGQQTATAMEFLARQEQQRQQRLAELSNRLDTLERAAHDTLIDAENDLAEILSNANRDRNGRAVFQDQDGNIRNEDGEIVDPTDVDMGEWDNDAPSWEQKDQAAEQVKTANTIYEQTMAIGDQIDAGELGDSDIQALAGDIDLIEAALEALAETSSSSVSNENDGSDAVTNPVEPAAFNHVVDMKPI